jgi:hypothetical protein
LWGFTQWYGESTKRAWRIKKRRYHAIKGAQVNANAVSGIEDICRMDFRCRFRLIIYGITIIHGITTFTSVNKMTLGIEPFYKFV